MRFMFIGALLFSLFGFVITGGVLAWENSAVVPGETVTVGEVGFDVRFERYSLGQPLPEGAEQEVVAGPGTSNSLGRISIANYGDYNLRLYIDQINGSRVVITGVRALPGAECAANNFTGVISDYSVGILAHSPGPAQFLPDVARVSVKVSPGAPPGCVGATISYDIVVAMTATLDTPS